MYLYAFNMYAGFDKVFILNEKNSKFTEGDIIQNKEWFFFLVLWENISFPEVYNTLYSSDKDFTIIKKALISKETMNLIHRMVYERYSNYKNVMKFFIDSEIEKLLTKEIKQNKKAKSFDIKIGKIQIKWDWKSQTLIVFPDIRSYNNIVWEEKKQWIFLYSLDTQNIKNTNRRKIKTWNESLIYATSSEIFQDFNNLKEIYLIEPQKRYYASQQDPRYKVWNVLEKIAENYSAKINIINSEDL